MFDLISPLLVIISLGIGFIIAHISRPPPTIIYSYPKPENAHHVKYIDDDGVCYKYNYEEVEPPINQDNIKVLT